MDSDNPLKPGIGTVEFKTAAGVILGQIAMTVATLYLISPTMGLSPTEKIAAVAALATFIGGSTWTGNRLITSRENVKTAALRNPASLKAIQDQSEPLDPVNLGDSEEVTFVYSGVTICLSRR